MENEIKISDEKQEIIRIDPCYQDLSSEKKKDLLILLNKWAINELKKLEENGKQDIETNEK